MTIGHLHEFGDSPLQADVCVIGSGAAGIALARQLDGSGLDVVVLEAGGSRQDVASEADDFAVEHVGHPFRNPIPTRGRWYGGSTNLWFGRIATPDPIDFEERDWVPFSGWPLTRDELMPWMRIAARILEVGWFERIDAANWPPNATIQTFADGGLDVGVFLWADALYMGRRARAQLLASRNVRVVLGATVTGLRTDDDMRAVTAVDVAGEGGRRAEVVSRTFVLAAGGLENPRLLLASTSRSPDGLGNRHGNVGRFYLDHPRTEALATLDLHDLDDGQLERLVLLGEKAGSEIGTVQLRVQLPEQLQRDERLLNPCLHVHFASSIHEHPAMESARRLRDRVAARQLGLDRRLAGDLGATVRIGPALLAHRVRHVLGATRPATMVVVDQLEQEPDPDSRVTVDHTRRDRWGLPRLRLDWRIGMSTTVSQRRLHELVRDVLERNGIRGFRSELLDDPDLVPDYLDMKHPAGTTRMAEDPALGVVDRDCRVHGIDNLYVAGSSVFPTSGHFNPTLLIVGLAARIAARLRRTGG
jgi:choline dehydrogenase-like flavoprotein